MTNCSLTIGSIVTTEGMRGEFTVVDGPNKKNQFKIAQGTIVVWVDVSALKLSLKDKLAGAQKKLVTTQATSKRRVRHIDLHGKTVEQSKYLLDDCLNAALLENIDQLEILHGLGTGKVRNAVHNYLKTSKLIKRFELDQVNPGITRAWL